MDDTRWTVRVTSSITQGDHSIAYARKHAFAGGDALSFDVEHPHVTAFEYLLGAAALDIAGGLRRLGKKRRIDIDAIEVLVHGKLHNPMLYLGVVGEEGDGGVSVIAVKVYISSLDDEDAVTQIWTEMLARSPIVNTLRKCCDLQLTYQQVV